MERQNRSELPRLVWEFEQPWEPNQNPRSFKMLRWIGFEFNDYQIRIHPANYVNNRFFHAEIVKMPCWYSPIFEVKTPWGYLFHYVLSQVPQLVAKTQFEKREPTKSEAVRWAFFNMVTQLFMFVEYREKQYLEFFWYDFKRAVSRASMTEAQRKEADRICSEILEEALARIREEERKAVESK